MMCFLPTPRDRTQQPELPLLSHVERWLWGLCPQTCPMVLQFPCGCSQAVLSPSCWCWIPSPQHHLPFFSQDNPLARSEWIFPSVEREFYPWLQCPSLQRVRKKLGTTVHLFVLVSKVRSCSKACCCEYFQCFDHLIPPQVSSSGVMLLLFPLPRGSKQQCQGLCSVSTRVFRVQTCFLHKLFVSVLLWGWQEGLGGMEHTRKCPCSQYQWSSCWGLWGYSDCHQFQHLCGSGVPGQCLNLTLLLLISGVPVHCQVSFAHDGAVLKPCAKITSVFQCRQVICTSWKPSSVLQLVHLIAKTFRPSCITSGYTWSNFLGQQQELADS